MTKDNKEQAAEVKDETNSAEMSIEAKTVEVLNKCKQVMTDNELEDEQKELIAEVDTLVAELSEDSQGEDETDNTEAKKAA